MTLVLAVANLKGGVGKSTIAMNVAACLYRGKYKSLVVDADGQGTCRTWAEIAAAQELDGPPVIALEGQSLRRDLARVSAGFDVAVVDAPPRLGKETRAAMLVAHLVLIPVLPGPADAWALQQTIAALDEAREVRQDLKAAVVLNRADPRTALTWAAVDALETCGLPRLKATLGSRVAFGEAVARGVGVVDYAARSRAAEEILALTQEVSAMCGSA